MKIIVIIINIGRGGIINYDDFYEVLIFYYIVVVGFDVIELELFFMNYLLFILNNCVIFLYMGSNIWELRNYMVEIVVENVISVLNKGCLKGEVL